MTSLLTFCQSDRESEMSCFFNSIHDTFEQFETMFMKKVPRRDMCL